MTNATLGDIDTVAIPTENELARQKFVSTLRKAALVDIGGAMKRTYETGVEPAFEKAHGHKPVHARDIRDAMEDESIYRFYSSLRYNAQEMVWESVRPQIERHLPEMIA